MNSKIPRRKVVEVGVNSGYRGHNTTYYKLECGHTAYLRYWRFSKHPKTTLCTECARRERAKLAEENLPLTQSSSAGTLTQ
jgi:hypothetical protein